jgi:hypothetical protein
MKRTVAVVLIGALILSLLILSAQNADAQSNTFTFTTLGDYGVNNASAAAVASMVNGWNPDIIITLGDNYHLSTGGVGSETYDLSTGKHYCNFLKNIHTTGTFCPTGQASSNRFFPTLGDHDYTDAGTSNDGLPGTYTDYFTLPGAGYVSSSGNERYYDFVFGSVHFFILNGLEQPNFEPDGVDSTSIQAQWLKTQLGASTSTWNVVVVHKPPYSSGTKHAGAEHLQWPFAQWGADVVFSGHEHNYERIHRDGIVYFVNGLGGDWIYPFGTPIEGSAARYNATNGAQRVTVTNTSMTVEFHSIENGGTLIDSYTITTPHRTATPTLPLIETGWQNPRRQAASGSNGDKNGYEGNPTYAFADDSLTAVDMDSGTDPALDCADSGKDKHRFLDYNFPIPDGALVQGIQVRLDAKADSVDGTPKLCVSLSWDAGLTWSPWKISPTLTDFEKSYLLGGNSDTWGYIWTSAELSNTNFQVRVANIATDNERDFSLDWIAVNTTYSLKPMTSTSTPTLTESPTDTPTASPTETLTATATLSSTATTLETATQSPTATLTSTPEISTLTNTFTVTPSLTTTMSQTATATASNTPTHSASSTATPTQTFTPTATLVSPPSGGEIDIRIGGNQRSYSLGNGQSLREGYVGLNDGPIKVSSTNATLLFAGERVIYKVNGINTSLSEMMGLPSNQLDTTYWLPWYNNIDLDTQLRFANVSGSPATVTITIGTQQMGDAIQLAAGASTRVSFAGVNNGPVKIVSTQNIVAAERLIYKVNGKNTSFSEMMALPNKALDTTYWLPWYNNRDLDTQLRFANVSNQPASVHVYIGGDEMEGSPFPLLVGESTRKSFPGINNGPVKIVSDQNIVAAERLIYKVGGVATSFTEMMALPNSQLNTSYWLPWYNNRDLDTQLRFANVHDTQTAQVHVYIGGVEMPNSPFTLLPGESTRQSFAGVNNGPVQIVSNVSIVTAERLIYKVNGVNTSFSEMMALPHSLLDTTYWLPWYNNVDLDTQLRFGIP